jgi:hypothetical protein
MALHLLFDELERFKGGLREMTIVEELAHNFGQRWMDVAVVKWMWPAARF